MTAAAESTIYGSKPWLARYAAGQPASITVEFDSALDMFKAAVARDPDAHQQNIKALMDLYAAGKIKPYVSERFPLSKAADAITHLASRKAMGKAVVTMD